MRTIGEIMILRHLRAGLLIALSATVGTTGLMASEYDFAPREALGAGQELQSHELDQSHLKWSDVNTAFDACPVSHSCAKCGGGVCNPPAWYWEQNLRVLGRSRVRRIPLTFREAFPDPTATDRVFVPIMTNRSLSFDVAAGYDTTVGHYLGRDSENRDQFVEFTYWGMNVWNESRRVNGDLGIYTDSLSYSFRAGMLVSPFPVDVGGFNRAETQYANYRSDIDNFELNVRFRPRGRADRMVLKPSGKWQRECQPRKTLSYLIGLRYLSLSETFGWHSRGSLTDLLLAETGSVSGDYDIRTHNELVGPQIGADLMFHRCRYSFGVQTKVAPLINFSDQRSTVVTSASLDPLATYGDINDSRYAKRDDISLVGEVSILGNYRIRKDLTVHAGYHFAWVAGVALAGEQIQFVPNAAATLNDNGHVFYQGVSGGLEWIW